VAIVAAGELKYGLRVDAFLDSMEIVVKPFGRHLAKCTRYAGATILGDGQVALILDVAGIGKALGMERIPSAAEAAGNPPAGADPEGQAPGCEYLVVEDGAGGSFALPLDRVIRIERIPAGGIAAVGRKLAYSHPGGCLALLAPRAPAADDVPPGSGKAAYAAVFQAGGAEYGLLVSEILDIVRTAGNTDAARFAQPGFLGAVRVGERLSLVPDLDELAARATRGEMETDMRRSS
jgi:two-component system chemotaxis sensor kinase CheA